MRFSCVYGKKRKTFRENSSFKAFLLGYSLKILREHQRNQIRDSKLVKKQVISPKKPNPFCPEKAYFYAELLNNIKKSKDELSVKQRDAIDLLLDPYLTPETAAKEANCSYNTLRQRRFAARKILEKLLKK